MENYTHKSTYFYGNKVSDYGLQNGFVDYATLSKSFNAVLCNDITKLFFAYAEPQLYNGNEYDEDSDTYADIFQYYIIDERGAEILAELTDEIVYYIEELGLYIWGVTHYGTSWDYVLTDIKIELDK
jgi:hypothetical protein